MPSAALQRLAEKANATLVLANAPTFPLREDIARAEELQVALEDIRALSISVSYYFLLPRDTFYIAFVGHYSAGKSSTINSLLGTKRDSDVNPTDSRLTFISSDKNTRPILKTIETETTKVADFIEVQMVASEFTQNLVLIDTPGGGDPRIDRSLIQNFLPVCDAIAYFTSGAAPFNTTDKEVLRPYLDELGFIPMFFVVTRADEFRADKTEPLSATNYREDRAEQAVAVAKARLRDDFDLPGIENNPHILIDNVAAFGLDGIKRHIQSLRQSHVSREPQVVEHFQKRLDRGLDQVIDYVDTIAAYCATLYEKLEQDQAQYEHQAKRPNEELARMLDASANAIEEHRHAFIDRWPSDAALAELSSPLPMQEDVADRERVEFVWEKRREFLQRGGFLIDQIFRRFSQEFERDVVGAMLAGSQPDRPLTTDLSFDDVFGQSFDDAEALIAREFRLLWSEFRQAFIDYERSEGDFAAARFEARRDAIDVALAAVKGEAARGGALALEERAHRDLRSVADRAGKDFFILAQSIHAEVLNFKNRTIGDSVSLSDVVDALEELGLDRDGLTQLIDASFPQTTPERDAARAALSSVASEVSAFAGADGGRDARTAMAAVVSTVDIDGRLDEIAETIVDDAAALARLSLEKRLDEAKAVEREIAMQTETLAIAARKKVDTTIGWARHVANGAVLAVVGLVVYLINGGFLDILLPVGVGGVALGVANHFAIGLLAKRSPKTEEWANAQNEADETAKSLRERFLQQLRSGQNDHYLRGREAASRMSGRLEAMATAIAEESARLRAPEYVRQAQAINDASVTAAELVQKFRWAWDRFMGFVIASHGEPAAAQQRLSALGEAVKERTSTRRLQALGERRALIDAGLAELKRIRGIS